MHGFDLGVAEVDRSQQHLGCHVKVGGLSVDAICPFRPVEEVVAKAKGHNQRYCSARAGGYTVATKNSGNKLMLIIPPQVQMLEAVCRLITVEVSLLEVRQCVGERLVVKLSCGGPLVTAREDRRGAARVAQNFALEERPNEREVSYGSPPFLAESCKSWNLSLEPFVGDHGLKQLSWAGRGKTMGGWFLAVSVRTA